MTNAAPNHLARRAGSLETKSWNHVVQSCPFVTAVLLLSTLLTLNAAEFTLDFSKTNGVIRPLHGVNLGPLCYRGVVDLSTYHRELNLPLTRLHDVVWVNSDAVDISTIFRDFRNDPNQADNYDFAATDDYLAAVVHAGSPILYRLGESIEHTPRKYRVNPPRDFAKWADVCCAVIRHYNEGWAGGFHHQIRYWEIWNEPENQPAMWTGTDEQYFKLYEVTAKAIKSRWPDLKVGGPSLGYTGEWKDGQFKPGDFLLRFLQYCREHETPLDFFSWHRYAGQPWEFVPRARLLRQLLDQYGFNRTESHLNEWNYLPNEDWHPMTRDGQGQEREQWSSEMRGPKGAAFVAWALMALQDAPVDMANFYTAEVQMFGMFNFNGVPQKNFYAFRAFRSLLDTPTRVRTPACDAGKIAICAGRDAGSSQATVLLANFASDEGDCQLAFQQMPWLSGTKFDLYLVDATHDYRLVRSGLLETNAKLSIPELKPASVVLLNLSPKLK